MRDFLKVLLLVLTLLAGGAVALLLSSAFPGDASTAVFFVILLLTGMAVKRLQQRLGLSEEDFDVEEPSREHYDWLGLIPTLIVVVVGSTAAGLWIRYAEAVHTNLTAHVGEFLAFVIIGPGAFFALLLFMVSAYWVFNAITGRVKRKPRRPDLRD